MKNVFDKVKTFLILIIILLGLFTIILVLPSAMAMGLIALSFGIMAIIWTSRAYWNLSKGSSLRNYAYYFLLSLTLIFIYSIWQTLGEYFVLGKTFIVIEAFCIAAAYLLFVVAAFKLSRIGNEFGFRMNVKNIGKEMNERVVKKKVSKKKPTRKGK
ncbi:MAG: hypothetical protein ABIG93_04015 [archaeon]|nr:hypothetical protein [Nanoarchaeota archaeon]